MKKLLLTLTLVISVSAKAKMTVTNAINNLNGEYAAVNGQKGCDDLTIDVSLDRGLQIHNLDMPSRFMNPEFANNADKVIYGTKNKGTKAFITLKDTEYSTVGDGYVGSLLSKYKDIIKYEMEEGSHTLTVTTTSKGWSLLHSSCTSSGFFDKFKSSKTSTYTNVQ